MNNKTTRDTEVHYHDPKEGDFLLDIKVNDNGNGEKELTIALENEVIVFAVSDDEGVEMYSVSFPYEQFMDFIEAGDFQSVIVSRTKQRNDAVKNHPASQLKLIDGGGKPLLMKIFEEIPEYEDWCKENGLRSNNDENYNSYSEWKGNQ